MAKEVKTMIDDTIDMPMVEVPKEPVQKKGRVQKKTTEIEAVEDDLVNCLRNERVIVRFVPRPTTMVQNPKHILYGGMADSATITYCVPRLSTGVFKNVLTDSEKSFLEKAMGLEYNALSVYKKQDNFWDDSNDAGLGRVVLHKQDNYLDLSNPEDYIRYKILLANKDQIASSLHELEDRPKATYRFVIISEDAESKIASNNMSVTMQCYKEYGKVEDDIDTLRVLIELLEGRPTAQRVKKDWLQTKVNEYIQSRPKTFLSIIKDDMLRFKVLIKKGLELGLIGKKNDCYFMRSDNTPLCEMNEESTLNNAAKYIANPKHQELLFMIQAKVDAEK